MARRTALPSRPRTSRTARVSRPTGNRFPDARRTTLYGERPMKRLTLAALVLLLCGTTPLWPQQKKQGKKPSQPTPTAANVAYGSHERQVLDFWQAKSDRPTPLVLYIHGGGWVNGDKISLGVAAINYRFVKQAVDMNIKPPVKAPLEDAARALQFIRSKAGEWNLDKKRVGATGGSAGGCSSLWLALHADLAKPNSDDAVARESTRLFCAAVVGAQTSLDPKELRAWMP